MSNNLIPTAEFLSDKKLHISDVIQQSEQFFCCVVDDGQPKCKEQCKFCKDWVDDAEEQKNCKAMNEELNPPSCLGAVSSSLSWIEKDRLAGIRLNEMRALAVDNSILNEVSSKVLRQLIIEGINIGLNYL